MKKIERANTTIITGPIFAVVPGKSGTSVASVVVAVDVVSVVGFVAVVDETINQLVIGYPFEHVAVTVRLSPTSVETAKESYIPQLYV